jgi:hypothetical protein
MILIYSYMIDYNNFAQVVILLYIIDIQLSISFMS